VEVGRGVPEWEGLRLCVAVEEEEEAGVLLPKADAVANEVLEELWVAEMQTVGALVALPLSDTLCEVVAHPLAKEDAETAALSVPAPVDDAEGELDSDPLTERLVETDALWDKLGRSDGEEDRVLAPPAHTKFGLPANAHDHV
jgi:hypothetical protein